MKSHIIIHLVGLLLLVRPCIGQQWIGNKFHLDTALVLQAVGTDIELSQLTYGIQDGVFYYTDTKSYQSKERNNCAVIHAVSLNDYEQYDIHLPLPTTIRKKPGMASTFWIKDFDFNGDRLVVSVQNHILLYKKAGNTYEYDTIYDHPFVKATYIHNHSLYYLSEDHDLGYKWFRRDLCGGPEFLIRELGYEAPHVVQAQPNRYLFRDHNYLYFLSTRYPVLHRYTLDGQWIGDLNFDIPVWHSFEEEYIKKTLSVPYGVERIYMTKDEIFRYSYPKYVFPFYDNFLLYYTQYDTLTQKSHLHYALYNPVAGSTTLWTDKENSTEPYQGEQFPFYLLKPHIDKARISWGNLLLEIVIDDTLGWIDRTPAEYQQARERFFRQNDPIYKLRIMRYKNTDWAGEPFFIDSDFRLHHLEELPYGKSILLVTNELECSACERQLLQLFNDSLRDSIHIGILHSYIPGALLERENRKRIKQHLEKPFGLYYLASNRYEHYPWERTTKEISYPALLYYETGKAPILFSLEQILNDDIYNYHFQPSFLDFWNRHINTPFIRSTEE